MNEKEKQEYYEQYHHAKEKGVPFFPDILFKDAVASILIFLALVALAYFLGAPLEAKANPSDNSYTPRPEWYFLFLFQLLKYFPGQLEVVGVVVIPTVVILLLFFLPLLDRGNKRHFRNRPIITGATVLLSAGVILLSIQSVRETPPPTASVVGDQTAALYTNNCAPCHGAKITVTSGSDLHAIIAQGSHEGMPAWSSDLSSDQIDALAGFILSPGGSALFTQACSQCHELLTLVESDPLVLKKSLVESLTYPAHSSLKPDQWTELSKADQTQLVNFLIAPDGRRLFSIYCAACHGKSLAFSGDEALLAEIINQGGLHLDMPAWKEKFGQSEINSLAKFVMEPASAPEAKKLFDENCTSCHGERIPVASSVERAIEIISTGGSHQTMPVWGQILTSEQMTALVSYTLSTTKGGGLEAGQDLFASNCSQCHGEFGEGGINPTNPNDIIFPISTAEYLKTRDDHTLLSIIAQGQPNYGMSPFGSSFGGPLDDDQINALVTFIRSWEADPPVELPPEVSADALSLSGSEIYMNICAQCHGSEGRGGVGSSFANPAFQTKYTDDDIFNAISKGHSGTSMIAWAGVLSNDQILALIQFIRQVGPIEPAAETDPEQPEPTPKIPTFAADITILFKEKCVICHGSMGGWDSSTYQAVMTSGNNAPTVIPGDPDNSLLVQKMVGTHKEGAIMPPGGKLPDETIQIIIDWIKAGAPEK